MLSNYIIQAFKHLCYKIKMAIAIFNTQWYNIIIKCKIKIS